MKKLGLILLCMLCLVGCKTTKTDETYNRYDASSTSIGFDTLISLTAYTQDEAEFKEYYSLLANQLTYYHQLFDKYNDYDGLNNVKTINDNAGKAKVKVDQSLIDMLKCAKVYSEISNNAFDITMGSVLNLWHDAREASSANPKQAYLPDMNDLQEAKKHTGWDLIEINDDTNEVFISDEKASLDVGAIAKGYALQQVSIALQEAGLQYGFINGGGNVVFINDKLGEPWTIGLQIPDYNALQAKSLLSFYVDSSTSFVTSGDYQRYYKVDDVYYHHIIDPQTLMPAKYARSVTILCNDSGLADALSTALYNLSYEDGLAVIEKAKEMSGLDVEAIWVFDDTCLPQTKLDFIEKDNYYIITSENIKNSIKK